MQGLKKLFLILAIVGLFLPALNAFAMNRRDADRIIDRAYRELLGRRPDESGAATYRRLLMEEGWNDDRVRSDLKKSREYKNRSSEALVKKAYRDVLGREADPNGLNNYRKRMNEDGWSEKRVRDDLRNSDEYRNRRAELMIREAYREILGRDPDPGGMRTFREKVEKDRWSLDDVKRALMESDEYRRKRR